MRLRPSYARRAGLSDLDAQREPRYLNVIAWFDGWGQAQGQAPRTYARTLTADELASQREGFAVGVAERRAVEYAPTLDSEVSEGLKTRGGPQVSG